MEAPETQGKRTVFYDTGFLVRFFVCRKSEKGGSFRAIYRPLFICAVCINYRLNLLHKGIIVVLVINSAEH